MPEFAILLSPTIDPGHKVLNQVSKSQYSSPRLITVPLRRRYQCLGGLGVGIIKMVLAITSFATTA